MHHFRENTPATPRYQSLPASSRHPTRPNAMAPLHYGQPQFRDLFNIVSQPQYHFTGIAPQTHHPQFYPTHQNLQAPCFHGMGLEMPQQQFHHPQNMQMHQGTTRIGIQRNLQNSIYPPPYLMTIMPMDQPLPPEQGCPRFQNTQASAYDGPMDFGAQYTQQRPPCESRVPVNQPMHPQQQPSPPRNMMAQVYEGLSPALRHQHYQAFGMEKPKPETNHSTGPRPGLQPMFEPLPNNVPPNPAPPAMSGYRDSIMPANPNMQNPVMATNASPYDSVPSTVPAQVAVSMNLGLLFRPQPVFEPMLYSEDPNILEISMVVLCQFFGDDRNLSLERLQKLELIHGRKVSKILDTHIEIAHYFDTKTWNDEEVRSTLRNLGIDLPNIRSEIIDDETFHIIVNDLALLRFSTNFEWNDIAQILNSRNPTGIVFSSCQCFALFQVLFMEDHFSIRRVYNMIGTFKYEELEVLFEGEHNIDLRGRFGYFASSTTITQPTLTSGHVSLPAVPDPAVPQPAISQPSAYQLAILQPATPQPAAPQLTAPQTPPMQSVETHQILIDLTREEDKEDIPMALDTASAGPSGPLNPYPSPPMSPPQPPTTSQPETIPISTPARGRTSKKRTRKQADGAEDPESRPKSAKRRRPSPLPKPSTRKRKAWENRPEIPGEHERAQQTAKVFLGSRGKRYSWMTAAPKPTILDARQEAQIRAQDALNTQPIELGAPDQPTEPNTKATRKPRKGAKEAVPKAPPKPRGRPRKNAVKPSETCDNMGPHSPPVLPLLSEEDARFEMEIDADNSAAPTSPTAQSLFSEGDSEFEIETDPHSGFDANFDNDEDLEIDPEAPMQPLFDEEPQIGGDNDAFAMDLVAGLLAHQENDAKAAEPQANREAEERRETEVESQAGDEEEGEEKEEKAEKADKTVVEAFGKIELEEQLMEMNGRLPIPAFRRKEGVEYNWMGYLRVKVPLNVQRLHRGRRRYDYNGYEKFFVPECMRRAHRVYDEDGMEESDVDEPDD